MKLEKDSKRRILMQCKQYENVNLMYIQQTTRLFKLTSPEVAMCRFTVGPTIQSTAWIVGIERRRSKKRNIIFLVGEGWGYVFVCVVSDMFCPNKR